MNSEPVELEHVFRHLLQARSAIAGGYPCAARAHLREAQVDLRWSLRKVTADCADAVDNGQRMDAPDDEESLAAQLDPLISVARMKGRP